MQTRLWATSGGFSIVSEVFWRNKQVACVVITLLTVLMARLPLRFRTLKKAEESATQVLIEGKVLSE